MGMRVMKRSRGRGVRGTSAAEGETSAAAVVCVGGQQRSWDVARAKRARGGRHVAERVWFGSEG